MRHAPLHPALAHFPLALWGLLPLWDLLAWSGHTGPWWAIGFWTGLVALALAVPAAGTGLLELRRLPEGFDAEGVLIGHIGSMGAAFLGAAIALSLRAGPGPPPEGRSMAVVSIEVLVALLALTGGWLGGRLVYRHGVGRASGAQENR